MLADYCCNLIRETQTGENVRQKKTKRVFNEFLVGVPYVKTLLIIWYCIL